MFQDVSAPRTTPTARRGQAHEFTGAVAVVVEVGAVVVAVGPGAVVVVGRGAVVVDATGVTDTVVDLGALVGELTGVVEIGRGAFAGVVGMEGAVADTTPTVLPLAAIVVVGTVRTAGVPPDRI